jgi:Fe-Mn family superoxide dismutase
MTRREAITGFILSATSLVILTCGKAQTTHWEVRGLEAGTFPFDLPPLPYAFVALEPQIDAGTLQIHHDRIHAVYTTNLNKAIGPIPRVQRLPQVQETGGLKEC